MNYNFNFRISYCFFLNYGNSNISNEIFVTEWNKKNPKLYSLEQYCYWHRKRIVIFTSRLMIFKNYLYFFEILVQFLFFHLFSSYDVFLHTVFFIVTTTFWHILDMILVGIFFHWILNIFQKLCSYLLRHLMNLLKYFYRLNLLCNIDVIKIGRYLPDLECVGGTSLYI